MNINELIEQIGGRERLEALIEDEDCRVTVTEQEILVQIALAVLDAQENSTIRKLKALLWLERQQMAHPGMNEVRYAIELLTTPPAASVQDGWRIVPIEPTAEMLRTGGNVYEYCEENGEYRDDAARGIYSIMIAAAPAPGGDVE